MKTYLAAVALAALAQPAAAVTFPTLTTIYVGTGVYDDSSDATSIHCSNMSGRSAQVRVLVLGPSGGIAASRTLTLPHGRTETFATRETDFDAFNFETGEIAQGAVYIESTQSAVFCAAMIVSVASASDGVALHLVRMNPHPGTVE